MTLPAALVSTPSPVLPLLILMVVLSAQQPCSDTRSGTAFGHQHQQGVNCADRALQPCQDQAHPTGAKQHRNPSPVHSSLLIEPPEHLLNKTQLKRGDGHHESEP